MSPLDHSRYRGIDKSIDERLLLRSHGFSRQLFGVHECFFDGCRDRVLEAISDWMFYVCVDEVTKGSFVYVHGTAGIKSLRLSQRADGLELTFSSSKNVV